MHIVPWIFRGETPFRVVIFVRKQEISIIFLSLRIFRTEFSNSIAALFPAGGELWYNALQSNQILAWKRPENGFNWQFHENDTQDAFERYRRVDCGGGCRRFRRGCRIHCTCQFRCEF